MKRSRTPSFAAARRDDLLAAGELGGLAEHQRAAGIVQLVERIADRRVGAAARGRVRLAAFGGDPQFRRAGIPRAASSLAYCTHLACAAFEARMIVSWSPCSSMPKPSPACRSRRCRRPRAWSSSSSMPITTTAATFGLLPAPISVRKCRSRSAPNCSRPYGCGMRQRALDVVRDRFAPRHSTGRRPAG